MTPSRIYAGVGQRGNLIGQTDQVHLHTSKPALRHFSLKTWQTIFSRSCQSDGRSGKITSSSSESASTGSRDGPVEGNNILGSPASLRPLSLMAMADLLSATMAGQSFAL